MHDYIKQVDNSWKGKLIESFQPTQTIQQYRASDLHLKSFVMAVQFNTTDPVYDTYGNYYSSDDLNNMLQRVKINVRDIDGNSFEAAIGPWAYVNRGGSSTYDVKQYTLMCTGALRGCFMSQNFFTVQDDNYQLKPVNSMWGGYRVDAGNDITKRNQLTNPIQAIDVIRQVRNGNNIYNIEIPKNTDDSYFRIVIYGVPVNIV